MLTFGTLVKRNAANWGDHPAFVSFDRSVTWRDVDRRTDALGHALADLGVRPMDRVAMITEDCVEVAELFLACTKTGALRVGINARLAPREIAHILDDSQPRLLFVQAGLEKLAVDGLTQAEHVPDLVGFGGTHGCPQDMEELIARHASSGALQQSHHKNVMLCYTTGSTGLPKGAIYPHDQMLRSIMNIALCEGATHDDVWLHAMPAGGVPLLHMLRNIFHGSTTAIIGSWNPEAALTMIQRNKTTMTVMVPTMISSLLESGLIDKFDTSSMRLLGYGAAPLPPATIREAMDAFGCPFLQMYGTTELTGMSMMLFPSDHMRGLTERPEILSSAGKLLPYVDGRIVDEDGNEVETGATGELIISSEFVIPGYWNADAVFNETVREGWLHTGDMAYRDEEGYIYLGDRAKFRIKTGGYNVFPTEVENAIAEHPAVREVCVVGLPDPKWGESIHAVIVLAGDEKLDRNTVKEFCADKIATYKIPKSVDFWPELPKGATGKILKRQVIDHYAENPLPSETV